jgi:(p)ppGpp synthase/HD superfamily hydrolase
MGLYSANLSTKVDWIKDQHNAVNHMYGEHPYTFHLNAAVEETIHWFHFSEPIKDHFHMLFKQHALEELVLATWGHDLLEDTHCSYDDIYKHLGVLVAEIIFAVTNNKGRNRKERADKNYYKGIMTTPGATLVKLCDRIANVKYSKETGSSKYFMYRTEMPHFMASLFPVTTDRRFALYFDVITHLMSLFDDWSSDA